MSRLFIPLYFALTFSNNANCQDYFFKTWSSEFTATGQQINEYNGKYFLSSAKACDNIKECAFLSEIDILGNEIWRKNLDFLDITHRTTFIEDDTIYISGNEYFSEQKFILHKMTTDGDSVATFDVLSSDVPYTDMFLLAVKKFNNDIVLGGRGIYQDSMHTLMFVINENGSVDSVINPTSHTSSSKIWDITIDNENNLVVFFELKNRFQEQVRKIIRFDENYNETWSYTSDSLLFNRSVTKGCVLEDNKIAYVNQHPNRHFDSVHAINPDSTISWIYDWPDVNYLEIKIHRLETLNNGDILGMGRTTNFENDPIIEGAPYIFRMSPDGELLWEKIFVEIDPEDGESKGGAIWDVEELENGDLLGTGYLRNESWDVLLFKTDDNGCINEDDCDKVSIITTTEELSDDYQSIKLFPQPAVDNQVTLQVDQYIFSKELIIQCHDLQGRKLAITIEQVNEQEYVISNLSKGVLILELVDKEGKRIVEKIINL